MQENCAKRQTRLAPDHLFCEWFTTAAGGCIFVVVGDGGMRSGKSNGRDIFFFCSSNRGEDYHHHESEISYCSSKHFHQTGLLLSSSPIGGCAYEPLTNVCAPFQRALSIPSTVKPWLFSAV